MVTPNLRISFITLIISTTFILSVRGTGNSGFSIRSACQRTLYQDLCMRSFSRYNETLTNPQKLAHFALSFSLYRAAKTRLYLLQVAKEFKGGNRDYQDVETCLEEINASVDQLKQSIKELRCFSTSSAPGNQSVLWHVSNVETWVSAALTDASTCMDEFPGQRMGKLKATIKEKVTNVAQYTSNALALFHRFVESYLSAGQDTNNP